MHTGRPLITSIAAGLGGAAEALGGAPWWQTATFFVLALAILVVAVVLVFPQKSEHRLAWWRDRRRHQQLRGTSPAPRGHRAAARRPEEPGGRAKADS